ncbi:MAG: lipoyl(octanoyl) transferase LipB [Candidatus Omnitrophota bacterium]
MMNVATAIKCRVMDFGLISYPEAYGHQLKILGDVVREEQPQLLFCEHPPVFTLGRLASEKNFLRPQEKIMKNKIDIIRTNRGGEVTFHGPGQMVIYPIFPLKLWRKDLKEYMEKLEQVVMDALLSFAIVAFRRNGQRGVFTPKGKIASIGIGVRQWVTFHGLALNVNTDLNYFSMIKPCGLDTAMTTMHSLCGQPTECALVKKEMIRGFSKIFNMEMIYSPSPY